ncbi:MAG: hypothetical protein AAF806_20430 [Bacteroidota bacterium]
MKLAFPFLLLLFSINTFAQSTATDSVSTEQPSINKSKLWAAIMTESSLYLGSMAYLQFVWYKDHERILL